MKSTVERLSPTRVRINVEVPFTELKPDFDKAYKQLAKQVRLPGFRPGKAPARLLEARIGRGAVLEQVVNDALPSRYSQAITSSEVQPLGQPTIEITKLQDGDEFVFTAEVDVRPEISVPDFAALAIGVDAVTVEDSDVDAELDALRARFGTTTAVDRAAQTGDVVSIDLSASVDGEELADAKTEGLTHEVGTSDVLDGLDEAIVGLSAGESRVFTTTLAGGEHAGREAQATVTVQSVKERELPEPDDDFAQLASEFDTIDELRASLVEHLDRVKRVHQAEQIRNLALETMLEQVEVPLPESVVQAQIDQTLQNALKSFDNDERRFADALAAQNRSREEFDAESRENAEKAIKTQLLVDAVADALKIEVTQNDLTERLALQARQYGMEPQQLLKFFQETNQLPLMFADVRRGKALAAVVQAATVTDSDGKTVDTEEFFGTGEPKPAPIVEPVAEVPAAEEPSASAEQPSAEEPAAEQPPAAEPSAEESAAEEPAEQPDEPSAAAEEAPAAEDSGAESGSENEQADDGK